MNEWLYESYHSLSPIWFLHIVNPKKSAISNSAGVMPSSCHLIYINESFTLPKKWKKIAFSNSAGVMLSWSNLVTIVCIGSTGAISELLSPNVTLPPLPSPTPNPSWFGQARNFSSSSFQNGAFVSSCSSPSSSFVSSSSLSWSWHMNETCYTHKWVMSRIWMRAHSSPPPPPPHPPLSDLSLPASCRPPIVAVWCSVVQCGAV